MQGAGRLYLSHNSPPRLMPPAAVGRAPCPPQRWDELPAPRSGGTSSLPPAAVGRAPCRRRDPEVARQPHLLLSVHLDPAPPAPPTLTQGLCESVRLLVAAGARLDEDPWMHALALGNTELLRLILSHRGLPGAGAPPEGRSGAPGAPGAVLSLQELRGLVCVALSAVRSAPCWLPLLLRAGLDPSLLLQPNMLQEADGDVLNYLLAFVNWSTLSPALRRVLDLRLEERSWSPHACYESVPCLSHLCRLTVGEVVGRPALHAAAAVQQLPVPPLLQRYLRYAEVPPPPGAPGSAPLPLVSDLTEEYRHAHTHRHVV
ncbi:unnamed protein product [Boreogadus saida]